MPEVQYSGLNWRASRGTDLYSSSARALHVPGAAGAPAAARRAPRRARNFVRRRAGGRVSRLFEVLSTAFALPRDTENNIRHARPQIG